MPSNTDIKQLEQIRQYVESANLSLQEARALLEEMTGGAPAREALSRARQAGAILSSPDGASVIEGAFDGQNMMGPDGKQYSVPANYASKSKLVEGDLLKLTITANGSFIYKQIGPVERKRVRGVLVRDEETDEWRVLAEEKSYKVLFASVTYFKGEAGNDVVILVPRDKPSTWAAVENIIHAGEEIGEVSEIVERPSAAGARADAPAPAAASVDAAPAPVQAAPVVPPAPHINKPAAGAPSDTVKFDDDKDEFEEI
ncbi:hypothetical protein A3J43_03495 [Candidatus Uhrbacteria bacterium RIFCSPHIGHO2_12_FULL_54_23]|uniref:50S ribosomal protein L7/L12 n=3 Tax=Candidatus Uhriibacteriota TaxID=1752732 RepID=A0A1F7UPV2_9BACT|nr:MAG: hypothetical protein A3J43_03495 [Candidatus Uhrbacteria bacterium RIFCSPHIGHO2_12_FULL_54_23]OGL85139.1 MAG: hypothetical protein A3B36_02205 [Candidatus Uhrbacteria bacterium RIFCSPLOWO2_01_FULL_55_36]OGL91229.1 MAG: hypothetical protein A3J36_02205 [Candidatus Uhrbacteria bacterium RIFCSPLOWO2_02_FULL_54_37]